MTADNLTMTGPEEKEGKISLDVLARMTGFPVEMIREEIFKGQSSGEEISMDDLRAAMLSYIDTTILVQDDK